jgi:hypothetical protein
LFSRDLGEFKFEQVRSHATDPTSLSMTKHARNTWGGARDGAGRPRAGARSSEPHKTRPELARPELARRRARVLVIARFEDAAARRVAARRVDLASAIARAIELSRARADFRIVQLAARADRVELVIEATDKHALARGMQGFQVSAARGVNRAARRTGRVFVDRYRARVLASRPALAAALARFPRKGAASRVYQ